MKYTHNNRDVSGGGRQAYLHIENGDDICLLTVETHNERVSIQIVGDGVSGQDADWILSEIAQLLPPDFTDPDDHENRVKKAI